MTKIVKTDAEWRAELDPEVFRVARQGGTERAGSHPGFPKADGGFKCACCDAELFTSETKYESGSGWPSFWQPVSPDAVEERVDLSHGMRRTEVLCARCDAHLGHVFPDGPQPTGLRYCMNGVAMTFEETE